ncbi:Transposase IS605 family domain-containing protein [Desulfonema magnum]|uniref:Transposase IS605 family domain-containing protein n=2 Tax=Desulfonema magnum TaxID=45655 RepID=A0A975BVG6_9BACT|nr:Transposase IS605 family domain-containing protein [Desulfonema magnum]
MFKIYSPFCMSSLAKCTVSDVTKTKLIRLSPTRGQKRTFKHWTDVSRYVFNQTIDYIRTCIGFTPSWMDIKKDLLKILPEWCDDVPYQVKGIAVKEARQAFFKAKGHPKFRALKNPEQSCFIPKTAIKETGIYPTISGKGLFFHEALPENFKDSRLIWRHEKWWVAVPHTMKLREVENQDSVVALDPGVRSFITFYSPDFSGNIGQGDFSRIRRLCHHLDNLLSKRDKCKNKQKRRSLTKASKKMRGKIRHLISELHFKTAKFLTDNFGVILLPTFETSRMTARAGRKIRKKTVRMMLTFSHYKFKQILKWKAFQTGRTVLDCCEAYTSKTHPQTGEIRNIGGAKWIRLTDGSMADRDIVGARNILLRALVDSPTNFNVCAVDNSSVKKLLRKKDR